MKPNELAAVIRATMPDSGTRADAFAPALLHYMTANAIVGAKRVAAFLATIAEESGEFRYTHELGGPDYLAKYDGRADLGNTELGDGYRFKGRGLLQITGRANYEAFARSHVMQLEDVAAYLESPEGAAESACEWWQAHGCNELADIPDFERVTHRVNGGLTHYDRRKAYYDRAMSALEEIG